MVDVVDLRGYRASSQIMTAIAEKEAERREKYRGREKKERGEKGSRRPKGEKREKCREKRDREMTERGLEEDLE